MNTQEFKQKYPPLSNTDDPFDVCIGNGWNDLVTILSDRLLTLSAQIREHVEIVPQPILVKQIKEKFGGLRYYIHLEPKGTRSKSVQKLQDKVHSLINQAEHKSLSICEICGLRGKLRIDLPHHVTLCNHDYVAAKRLENLG